MRSAMLVHWKTTAAAAATAAGYVILHSVDWKHVLMAAAIAAWGAVMKDFDK